MSYGIVKKASDKGGVSIWFIITIPILISLFVFLYLGILQQRNSKAALQMAADLAVLTASQELIEVSMLQDNIVFDERTALREIRLILNENITPNIRTNVSVDEMLLRGLSFNRSNQPVGTSDGIEVVFFYPTIPPNPNSMGASMGLTRPSVILIMRVSTDRLLAGSDTHVIYAVGTVE